jgi:hypothetical protein
MNSLKSIGLEFAETMSGWIGIGKTEYEEGRMAGQQENPPMRFDAKIIIEDLDSFIKITGHRARLEGSVTFKPLGGTFAMEDGAFSLFSVEPVQGLRQMIYAFRFTTSNGKTYFLYGEWPRGRGWPRFAVPRALPSSPRGRNDPAFSRPGQSSWSCILIGKAYLNRIA